MGGGNMFRKMALAVFGPALLLLASAPYHPARASVHFGVAIGQPGYYYNPYYPPYQYGYPYAYPYYSYPYAYPYNSFGGFGWGWGGHGWHGHEHHEHHGGHHH